MKKKTHHQKHQERQDSDKFTKNLSHMTDADFHKLFAANDKNARDRQAREITELKKLMK